MSKKVLIEIGSAKATATLFDKQAPKICRLLWDALPFEGPANHAKTSGGEIEFMVPIFVDLPPENLMINEPGCIGFWNLRSCICVFYDKLMPPVTSYPIPIWAKVTENLEAIQAEGRKLWVKQGKSMKIRRLGAGSV